MAKMTFKIPNGDYCSDKTMLDCLAHNRDTGFHMCCVHCEPLENVKINTLHGKVNTYKKCNSCLKNMQDNNLNHAHIKMPD